MESPAQGQQKIVDMHTFFHFIAHNVNNKAVRWFWQHPRAKAAVVKAVKLLPDQPRPFLKRIVIAMVS